MQGWEINLSTIFSRKETPWLITELHVWLYWQPNKQKQFRENNCENQMISESIIK